VGSHTDQENRFLQVLEISRKLLTPIDLDPLLAEIVDIACTLHGADRATVFLYDGLNHELYARVAKGAKEIRFSADRGIAGASLQGRQIVNVPDCYADPRFNIEVDKASGYRTNNLLTVPLIGDDQRAVGVLQVLNKRSGCFDADDETLAQTLAVQAAVALSRALLVEDRQQKEKMERDLEVASDIQKRSLPASIPQEAGYDIAGWSDPAEETGGDVYDAVQAGPGQIALLLGDATGHGVGPALSVTQVRAMFRLGLRVVAPLPLLVQQINAQLHEDLPDNRFVTAMFGQLDAQRHELRYLSAGQAPLLHYVAAEGATHGFHATTVPLGILEDVGTADPETMRLAPGDVVALLSDGFYEYRNPEGEEYGQPRVEAVLHAAAEQPAAAILEAIRRDIARFACGAPQLDDMTILIVKRSAAVQ
jgi:phosphoserine phosphatase